MSQELEKRKRSHINQLRLNKHNNYNLQIDWNTYGGENFKFETLHSFEEVDDCREFEIKLINEAPVEILYNIVKDSSVGGDVFTNNPRKEELRQMKKSQMTGVNNHQYGKVKSVKMINSVKEANSKKIEVDGIIYKSLTECANQLQMKITTISYRLKSNNFENWNYIK